MDKESISKEGRESTLKLTVFQYFLAALSSSRSLVVGPSVGPSVRHVCEKVTFRVSKGSE